MSTRLLHWSAARATQPELHVLAPSRPYTAYSLVADFPAHLNSKKFLAERT